KSPPAPSRDQGNHALSMCASIATTKDCKSLPQTITNTSLVMAPSNQARHLVAVVGAATAGSEIARILADRGALVIVFEQNLRPYGKIEDGLPRWHVKQRKDEYEE